MADVRPLRELLTDLVGDAGAGPGGPEAYLAEHGHTDLPPDLVAEAVVNFADTAPPEVAEQLAPFVTAHTSGDETAATDWFDLLTSAPLGDNTLDDAETPWSGEDFAEDTDPGLDFGAGAVDTLDAPVSLEDHETPEAPVDWPNEAEQPSSETEETTPDVVMAMDLDEDVDEDPLD